MFARKTLKYLILIVLSFLSGMAARPVKDWIGLDTGLVKRSQDAIYQKWKFSVDKEISLLFGSMSAEQIDLGAVRCVLYEDRWFTSYSASFIYCEDFQRRVVILEAY